MWLIPSTESSNTSCIAINKHYNARARNKYDKYRVYPAREVKEVPFGIDVPYEV